MSWRSTLNRRGEGGGVCVHNTVSGNGCRVRVVSCSTLFKTRVVTKLWFNLFRKLKVREVCTFILKKGLILATLPVEGSVYFVFYEWLRCCKLSTFYLRTLGVQFPVCPCTTITINMWSVHKITLANSSKCSPQQSQNHNSIFQNFTNKTNRRSIHFTHFYHIYTTTLNEYSTP